MHIAGQGNTYLSLLDNNQYENLRRERYSTQHDDVTIAEPKEDDDGYLSVAGQLMTPAGSKWYIHTIWKFRARHKRTWNFQH